ncbi:hypothetical protein OQJ26_15775 [Legionella sp. PATHC038]|uniref:hypothetical protein n=1 Tax=Legionella sheltonii TaxID=2992041 RepID=UPI0022444E49|nr:hypothetical protein [Legionella sp. PATHC038]MCW8400244.1 hypothetical protein [Legionella sp. PATHC038]
MTIRVLSFDFDGCLFNTAYSNAPYTNFDKHLTDAVLIHNKEFLEQLKVENERFSQVIAMIGSNRQSFEYDTGNMGGIHTFKGSCCSAIQTVCNYLDVDFNPLLLADLYNSLEPGTSYQHIMEEIKAGTWINMEETLEHQNCPMDESKVALIFAQMQEAASKNPDEQIIFDFYDDRDDILARLQEFYSSHPHMIPKNVLLRLNHYDGAEPVLEAELVGDGVFFNDYPEIVVNMLDNLWEHNDIAMEIKSNRHKPEMLQPVMQSEQFDSSDAVEEGEKESDSEQQNQSVDLVGAAQVDEQTEKEAVEISVVAVAIEEKAMIEQAGAVQVEEQSEKEAVEITVVAPAIEEKVVIEQAGGVQVEEQSEKEAVEITVAAPAAAGKAPGAPVASAASNLGRNRHSFHNQAARSTTHRGPAPIPAKYFEDSCGFSSGNSSCILS